MKLPNCIPKSRATYHKYQVSDSLESSIHSTSIITYMSNSKSKECKHFDSLDDGCHNENIPSKLILKVDPYPKDQSFTDGQDTNKC